MAPWDAQIMTAEDRGEGREREGREREGRGKGGRGGAAANVNL